MSETLREQRVAVIRKVVEATGEVGRLDEIFDASGLDLKDRYLIVEWGGERLALCISTHPTVDEAKDDIDGGSSCGEVEDITLHDLYDDGREIGTVEKTVVFRLRL